MASSKKSKSKQKPKALSHGRPPIFRHAAIGSAKSSSAPALSSKATRTIIRTHHTLHKQLAAAEANGDVAKATALKTEIEAHGGLQRYQQASLLGQATDRGGDSSRILMGWLEALMPELRARKDGKLKMLEVGALSTTNACARSGVFDIERIDLNSQDKGITKQDFMQRPLPADIGQGEEGRFDIISLSLVVNYVPDPLARGEMLERTTKFLQRRRRVVKLQDEGDSGATQPAQVDETKKPKLEDYFPSVFLVLPAPCITNSRYLDQERLDAIMSSLGYEKVREKETTKLIYYLYVLKADSVIGLGGKGKQKEVFKKTEIRSGKSRNNFAIVLR